MKIEIQFSINPLAPDNFLSVGAKIDSILEKSVGVFGEVITWVYWSGGDILSVCFRTETLDQMKPFGKDIAAFVDELNASVNVSIWRVFLDDAEISLVRLGGILLSLKEEWETTLREDSFGEP